MFKQGVFDSHPTRANEAAQLLFLLTTIATWLGTVDSAREIVKERAVLAREAAVGVRLSAYLASKLALLWTLVIVQVLLLGVTVFALQPLHEPTGTTAAAIAILALAGITSVAMGLLISASVRSDEQAMSLIPLALIPQLLFGGAIVPIARMGEPVKALSAAVFEQWVFAGVGTAVDMNGRIAADRGFAHASRYGPDFFDLSVGSLLLILAAFVIVFLGATALGLRRRAAV